MLSATTVSLNGGGGLCFRSGSCHWGEEKVVFGGDGTAE